MKISWKVWGIGITCMAMLSGCSEGTDSGKITNAQPTTEKVGEKQRPADNGSAETVKSALQELIRSCNEGDYKRAGELMIYRGENVDMKWKEPVNYLNEEDKPYVEKTCAQLQAVLHGSKELVFKEFITEEESEGIWHIWLVNIIYTDGQEKETSFAFLPFGDKFGLGDMD